jgi:hypothetical protein
MATTAVKGIISKAPIEVKKNKRQKKEGCPRKETRLGRILACSGLVR